MRGRTITDARRPAAAIAAMERRALAATAAALAAAAMTAVLAGTALVATAIATTPARAGDDTETFAAAAKILQSRCATPACHAGPRAAQGLRLETGQIYRTAVNVRARTDGRYLRVDPGAPERSLLVLKLL